MPVQILQDINFRVILEDWGSKWQYLPFWWSWHENWKRKDSIIREHWFWNVGLRNLQCTSTQNSRKLQAEPVPCFFRDKKQLLNVLLTCTFMPWLLNSLYLSRYGSEWWHPRWWLWLTMVLTNGQFYVLFSRNFFVYLFMVKEYIYLVIQMYFMQIYFDFLWFGNKFTIFFVFPNFCWS